MPEDITVKLIEDELKEITILHNELMHKGQQLKPHVLQHFNSYVKNVINPKLPTGHVLVESEYVSFGDRLGKPGFEITTGLIKSPSGFSRGPWEFERIIIKLCDEYRVKAKWVVHIDYGFELSR